MDIMDVLEQIAKNAPIIGLSSYLGKVWATRIARKEDHVLQKEIRELESELATDRQTHSSELDKSKQLILALRNQVAAEQAQIREKRVECILTLWKEWLDAWESATAAFPPYELVTEEGLKRLQQEGSLKSADEVRDRLNGLIEFSKRVERQRILLPAPIYEHLLISVRFTGRILVNVQIGLIKEQVRQWLIDPHNGSPDGILLEIFNQANDQKWAPASNGLLAWKRAIEDRGAVLVTQYFDSSIDEQIKFNKRITSTLSRDQIESELDVDPKASSFNS